MTQDTVRQAAVLLVAAVLTSCGGAGASLKGSLLVPVADAGVTDNAVGSRKIALLVGIDRFLSLQTFCSGISTVQTLCSTMHHGGQ